MKITIRTIKENKDGSADATVVFDKEGLEFLVQEGVIAVLKQYAEQNKNAKAGIKLRKRLEKKNERTKAGEYY
jgi:hypothetical protein